MPYGYYGRILRVNLSTGAISEDQNDEVWYRRYMGGAAMSAYYLLKELKPGVDPLGPDNKLIIAPGVLTGVPASGMGRNGVGAKSPQSGGIAKSEVAGFFGSELKHAGFDGIIVEGEADKPVYLWIKDGKAEIRDAGKIWGLPTLETQEAIRDEVGDRLARVSAIGPAGERLVRFACIMNDLKSAVGRGGLGAVMGSKKLKAIAARGKMPPAYANPDKVKALARMIAAEIPTRARANWEYGTGAAMVPYNAAGNVPCRNFRDGYFENAEANSAQAVKEQIRLRMESCYACAVHCKKVVKVDEPWVVDPRYGGPEYETLAAFGNNCGIDNLKAIARANHLCGAYGMDVIATGGTVAFAFECFEKGILSKADLDGLELNWGNAEAMLALVEKIGKREGIGDLLAEGSRMASRRIGRGAEELSMQVKGVELGMHDPRLKPGMGLGYAVANHGGDHGTGMMDTFYEKDGPQLTNDLKPLGILEPVPAKELSTRKVNMYIQGHRWRSVADSAVYCYFAAWRYDEVVDLLNAVTGWNTSVEELMLVGERAITLGRAFNVREGFTPADDTLPRRFFSPPTKGALADKKQAMDPAQLEEAKRAYYYLNGWDPDTGVPTRWTLERLDAPWAAEELARWGKLK